MSRRNYVYLASNIGEKKTFLRKKKVSKLQFIVTKDKVDFIFTINGVWIIWKFSRDSTGGTNGGYIRTNVL